MRLKMINVQFSQINKPRPACIQNWKSSHFIQWQDFVMCVWQDFVISDYKLFLFLHSKLLFHNKIRMRSNEIEFWNANNIENKKSQQSTESYLLCFEKVHLNVTNERNKYIFIRLRKFILRITKNGGTERETQTHTKLKRKKILIIA